MYGHSKNYLTNARRRHRNEKINAANNKLEDLSVKKLTKDNPTMRERFENLRGEKNEN